MFEELKRKIDAAEAIMQVLDWNESTWKESLESAKERVACAETEDDAAWDKQRVRDLEAKLEMMEVVKKALQKEVKGAM